MYVILKMVELLCCMCLVTQVFRLFNIVDTRNDTNAAIQKDYAKSNLDVKDCGCNFL